MGVHAAGLGRQRAKAREPKRPVAALLLCAGAAVPAAHAQAPAADAPGVVVTDSGNRIVYTAPYFAGYNVVTARDMLERIPGIQDLLDGGFEGASGGQRGFGNSGDQVLLNGKRLSGKFIDIGSTVSRIQARQVEQIEVIRGTVEGLDVRSRGRVVNLVLRETLVTGFGSWEASVSHYSHGESAPGAGINYSGQLGALNYVVSAESDPRRGRDVGENRFYTRDDVLFERQAEVGREESAEHAFTANTSYGFANGYILNVNALYAEEDETESSFSARFAVAAAGESLLQDELVDSEDTSSDWELGGDYEHVLGNGSVLTGLFVVTSSRGDEQSRLVLTPAGEPRNLDELQLERSRRSERILRGTYQWGGNDRRLLESGAEIALNKVNDGIELFEDDDGDGLLEETRVFNQASSVKETRFEAFTTYTWRASDGMLVEGSLDAEASELTQEGADVSRSRDFFFLRPRLVVRRDLSDQTQLRARFERTVNQLDFDAFTASFTNDDNRFDVISAGNPELEPEQSWVYELAYERRLPGDGGFWSITGRYRDVEDKEGRIPLSIRSEAGEIEERTAPGNIGDGTAVELEVNAGLRLGWLDLDRAMLEVTVEVADTDVTDPFTGERREFDFEAPYEWELSFRHDTAWRGFSYGFDVGTAGRSEQFDLDYSQASGTDPDVELFLELQPRRNLTLRLDVEELMRAASTRERLQYLGNRGDGLLARRELRFTEPVREVTLSLQGVFVYRGPVLIQNVAGHRISIFRKPLFARKRPWFHTCLLGRLSLAGRALGARRNAVDSGIIWPSRSA